MSCDNLAAYHRGASLERVDLDPFAVSWPRLPVVPPTVEHDVVDHDAGERFAIEHEPSLAGAR